MKWFFLLSLIPNLVFAAPADVGVPVVSEMSRLEQVYKDGKLSPKQKTLLAEIYFLTSRCSDLLSVVNSTSYLDQELKELSCFCSVSLCDQLTIVGRILEFKKKIREQKSFYDVEVQVSWNKVKAFPEAKYAALKEIRKLQSVGEATDIKNQAVVKTFEKELADLE